MLATGSALAARVLRQSMRTPAGRPYTVLEAYRAGMGRHAVPDPHPLAYGVEWVDEGCVRFVARDPPRELVLNIEAQEATRLASLLPDRQQWRQGGGVDGFDMGCGPGNYPGGAHFRWVARWCELDAHEWIVLGQWSAWMLHDHPSVDLRLVHTAAAKSKVGIQGAGQWQCPFTAIGCKSKKWYSLMKNLYRHWDNHPGECHPPKAVLERWELADAPRWPLDVPCSVWPTLRRLPGAGIYGAAVVAPLAPAAPSSTPPLEWRGST